MGDWVGRRLHFIGMGGAGMSGLALVARALKADVTGSDRAESSYSRRLREAGIEAAIGHDAANVPANAEIVVSTAIGADNPELRVARERDQTILHRGDLLAEMTRLKKCIAVSGTHGKTTTSGMIAHVLVETGRDPAYLIGGELRATGTNAAWGDGDWIVVEADESDRSFLKIAPDVAVITNIEVDHQATYRNQSEVEAAFADWAASAGETIAWAEAPVDADATYGLDGPVTLDALGSRFEVDGVDVRLAVPGEHNVINALGALAAAGAAGVPTAEAAPALMSFKGAKRRFEWRGLTEQGAAVFDDYAHHPTEVAATLAAARTLGAPRLVACFQPHLYSRTRQFGREFGKALALADVVVVMGIYEAREQQSDYPGVSGYDIARTTAEANGGRPVYWMPTHEQAIDLLRRTLSEGDLLLTLGAGDVDRVAEGLITDPEAPVPF